MLIKIYIPKSQIHPYKLDFTVLLSEIKQENSKKDKNLNCMNNSYCISFSIVTQHFRILCFSCTIYTAIIHHKCRGLTYVYSIYEHENFMPNNFCHYTGTTYIHFISKNLFHLNEYPLSMLYLLYQL